MTYQSPTANPLWRNRWQDWDNLILGIWLFISPWVLRFAATAPAATPGAGAAASGGNALGYASWNAWVLGVIVFLVALSALSRMVFWQSWITLVLGVWIFIAPWVLGFAGYPRAAWDHWIVGALIFLVSVANLWSARTVATSDLAHAGDKPQPPPRL
jgi:hypothetical protein